MSQETEIWLNRMTLIGFTEKRGNAWHYRSDLQGDEPNHYPGAIPTDDVLRRLFNFEVIEQPLRYSWTDGDGKNHRFETDRKLMICDDNGDLLGVFKSGYQGHSYKDWLVDNVSTILGDDLAIGSAGLLKGRAQAWVSVEIPETIATAEGVEFRPHLLASTSFDGSIATSYGRKITVVVCDNTLSAALSENGETYKVKHSKYSNVKISDAREALQIVYKMADDFSAEIKRLCDWKVSDKAFDKLLEVLVPMSESKAGITRAENKREEILNLYRTDERAAQWNGTAFGVLQAYNTWNHHFAGVRKGVPRILRNMENVVKDKYADSDATVLSTLELVTAK